MGMGFKSSAPRRAAAGAASTLHDTAKTVVGQGMCVRNGLAASANQARPDVSVSSREARSRTNQPFRRRRTASPENATGCARPASHAPAPTSAKPFRIVASPPVIPPLLPLDRVRAKPPPASRRHRPQVTPGSHIPTAPPPRSLPFAAESNPLRCPSATRRQ